MKSNIILFVVFCIIFCVLPVTAISQTVSFTQDSTWTCPSDVYTINLKMIGGGASGMGGYSYYIQAGPLNDENYGYGTGPGGLNGTYVEVNNIPVVPGESYSIVVGYPGVGTTSWEAGTTSGTTYGNGGGNSSAFGYTASGGVRSSASWTYSSGSSFSSFTLSHGPVGSDGYGNYQVATSGGPGLFGYNISMGLATSYGSSGGVGYGAGGGGGGAGAVKYGGVGGVGGNGGYGYVEITYDSASTTIILTGNVIDAYTSAPISGAFVNVTQNGIVYSTTTSSNGIFTINDAVLAYGIPLTITGNKSGYGPDINSFTPLLSGSINLTIPLISYTYYTNTSIVGIIRDNLYGNPIAGATYYAQDIITSNIYSATSNTNGLAIVTGLDPYSNYLVWANKTGYASPSAVLVKPYK